MQKKKLQQKSYLSYIVENSPDGIFTIDFDLNIRYVNPAFCRLINYSEEELIGSPITQHLGDLNILDVCMKSVEESGKCDHQETIFRRRDGSMVHISKMVQAIENDDGKVSEILITIRDMTHLHTLNKNLELSVAQRDLSNTELEETLNHLRQTQKHLVETEKMASLGSMVAGIAHEINAPVGIGLTAASSLRDEVQNARLRFNAGELKRSEMEKFMDHADQASTLLLNNLAQAANIINSFKQIAVDQTSEERRVIKLKNYCDTVLASMSSVYKNLPITIINNCDESIELNIPPGAIYQIISNLLLNSVAHAFDKNKPGNITISARKESEKTVFEYEDDGKGIDTAHINKIFDPFFTTRRGQGGSGLGLSIVYNLVTSTLKGTITAQSTVGKGTQFLITIP